MEYGSEKNKKRVIGLRRSERIGKKKKTNDKKAFLSFITEEPLEVVTCKDPNYNRTFVPYDNDYAFVVDAVRGAVSGFSVEAIAKLLNRPDVPVAQVVTNNDETKDEAVHERAIVGACPTLAYYKHLKFEGGFALRSSKH